MNRLIEQTMEKNNFLANTINEFKNVAKVKDDGFVYDITKEGKYSIDDNGVVCYDFQEPQNDKRYVIVKTSFHTVDICQTKDDLKTPNYYDNTNGSLYKVAQERGWNTYLFDIVKRLERAEKKGEFDKDLEKTINLIKLYRNECKI
jgi:hypothetical protein